MGGNSLNPIFICRNTVDRNQLILTNSLQYTKKQDIDQDYFTSVT